MTAIELEVPFGDNELRFTIPAEQLLKVVLPTEGEEHHGDESAMVREALARPVAKPPLREWIHPGQQIAIVVSDMTRPCPTDRLLPPVLEELTLAGVADTDVTVVVALGLHRAQTEEELEKLVGSAVYNRVRVVNHDPENTVSLGVTSNGTPVELFRPLVEAEVRISLGNLEFHYFDLLVGHQVQQYHLNPAKIFLQ